MRSVKIKIYCNSSKKLPLSCLEYQGSKFWVFWIKSLRMTWNVSVPSFMLVHPFATSCCTSSCMVTIITPIINSAFQKLPFYPQPEGTHPVGISNFHFELRNLFFSPNFRINLPDKKTDTKKRNTLGIFSFESS